MYRYKGLEERLEIKDIHKTDLIKGAGVSPRTLVKIAKNEKISDCVLQRIASFLGCKAENLCSRVSDNVILRALREEKEQEVSGGLYHELQIRMAFNSNHMEGSTLTEEQTRMIYETRTLDVPFGTSVDDVIEASNHFRCLNYCIDTAEEPLDEGAIKHLHRLLKQGTKEASLPWFKVGDYKQKPNVVGGSLTCLPDEVPLAMNKLLEKYTSIETMDFEGIVSFYHDFETIHPFQDGNGRVGRLIAFKECLRFGIVPFIIEDSKKAFYYRGLRNWNEDRRWLLDTCLDGQNTFGAMLRVFGAVGEE